MSATSALSAHWKCVSVVGLVGVLTSCGGARSAPRPAAPPLPAVGALPAAAPPAVPPPRDDGRLPNTAVPIEYRLHLSVNPAEKAFSGHVSIPTRIPAPTRAIVLHGRKLRIREAKVNSGGSTQTAKHAYRSAAGSKGDTDELVLTFETAVEREATLEIDYDADFSEGLAGLYRVDEGGKPHAFTQFEPFGARLAFPCFDEPAAKVPFEITLTVPTGLTALSNMPVRSRAPDAGGKTETVAFEKSPPLPTYLVALAVGPLEVREGAPASVPLRLAAVAGRAALGQAALDAAREQLAVLEGYFGTKYPYPKLDLVAVPNFAAGAMENAGLITFREERLLVDDKSPTSLRRSAYLVIAHELAHMWFGDLVTMEWWDDIWLNEGFATWMATKVVDTWRPELRIRVEALSGTAMAMHVDTLDSARAVRQPVRTTTETLEAFDGITYQKGAALLDMVERWIGPETFRAGVAAYLQAHRFGNARSEALFSALGAAAGGKPVPEVLRSFTEQTGVPSVELAECRLGEGRPVVDARQSVYRPLGAAPSAGKTWTFPVCVHHGGHGGHGGQKTEGQTCALVEGGKATLSLPGDRCPAWIHPNADQSGYYRAALAPEAFDRLAALPRGALTPRERTGLVSDAWALVNAGQMDLEAFVKFSRRFQGDPEPAVWERIVSALHRIDDEVLAPEQRAAFSVEARRILAPELAELGKEPRAKDGDAQRMRRRLVVVAMGTLVRDPQIVAWARKLAAAWLDDPKSVPGDQAATALQLAARNGDAALFDRIVKRLKDGVGPDERVIAVSALGQFTEPGAVRRAIELLVDGTIRSQDQLYVLRGLFGRSETREVAFRFVAERLDAFLDRIPPFARRRVVPVLAESCGAEERERASSLLAPRLASLEGADRGFAQALEEATRCGAFRAHHAPRLARWLAGPKKK